MRDVKLKLNIRPVYWNDVPEIRIDFNREVLFAGHLYHPQVFDWLLPAQDTNRLSVTFLNKVDADNVDGKDKAVVIDSIELEELRYDSFMHVTQYRPVYSEGYYRYAKENNITVEPVIHANYLGFNGEWYFEFTWPTFTWIYNLETQNMGWIYEKNI